MGEQPLTRDLAEVVESLHRTLEVRKEAATPDTPQNAPKPPVQIVQFPLWPESVRACPNSFLRSALFPAIHSKDRRFINDELLASCEGIEIRFKGEQLNQEDLDLCSLLFHLGRLHPLGDTCHFTAYAMLKALGRAKGSREYQDLHQSIRRLGQQVEIKIGRYRYFGAFVLEGVKDDITRHYNITLNPKLAALFAHGWTALEWKQRQELRGKHLALWLQGYYASHAAPVPVKVETLRAWSGSKTKDLYKFRQNLRAALDQLKKFGVIAAWRIDRKTDLVTVERGYAISTSQRRHLMRPKAHKRRA
jgi:TrfA protein